MDEEPGDGLLSDLSIIVWLHRNCIEDVLHSEFVGLGRATRRQDRSSWTSFLEKRLLGRASLNSRY